MNLPDEGCQRCGRVDPATDEYGVLLGGYTAVICVQCRNDWAQFVRSRPEIITHNKLTAESEAALAVLGGPAVTPQITQRYIDIAAERQQVEDQLFTLAEQWVAERPGFR